MGNIGSICATPTSEKRMDESSKSDEEKRNEDEDENEEEDEKYLTRTGILRMRQSSTPVSTAQGVKKIYAS